jgi:hypothetical protein
LAKFLIEKNFDLTIGLKSNRSETSSWINEMKLSLNLTDAGEFGCRVHKKKLTIGVWHDKGWFYYLSTTRANKLVTVERYEGRKVIEVSVIEAANYYTIEGMGCVDRFNQNVKTNDYKHKNFSWRSCHFQTLFRMILVNSWIILKQLHNNTFPKFLCYRKNSKKNISKE